MRPELIQFENDMPVKASVVNVDQYPFHWHDALEVIFVLEGQVTVGMGSETHLLKQSDIAIINIDEIHRIDTCGEDGKILLMQIDSAFCEWINPDYRYAFIYCCSPYHEAEAPEKYKKLKEYIARLVFQLSKKPYKDDNKDVKACLKEMLIYMLYSFDYLRWGIGIEEFDKKQVERLKKMYEYMFNHPAEKPAFRDMAEGADVTLCHLSHDIKKKFNQTFQELLHYSRCEHAAKLLLSTDKPITEISAECGFSDPKYLIKHFKLNHQYTPSQFRKMHRTDEKTLALQVRYHEDDLSDALEYLTPYISL